MVSTLYDVISNLPVTAIMSRHQNERKAAAKCLSETKPGDIVIFDRGYISLEMLKDTKKMQIEAIFRLPKSTLKEFQVGWEGDFDKTVKVKRDGLDIMIRLIRFKVKGSTIVLATTLLDSAIYPAGDIAALYWRRWNIEEGYKSLKKTLLIESWTSHSAIGVKQELYTGLIMLFLTRLIELSGKEDDAGGNRRKPSERICFQVAKRIVFQMGTRGQIRLSNVTYMCAIAMKHSIKYLLNRTYRRWSKKPTNKFSTSGGGLRIIAEKDFQRKWGYSSS